MKTSLLLLIVLVFMTSYTFAQGQKKEKDDSVNKTLKLEDVIKSINNSLAIAQAQLEGVELGEGSVTLQTTYDKEGTGGFKLFVKASKTWSKESSNSVTYKYKKPDTKAIVKNTTDKLALIIVDAANQYKNSSSITGLSKDGFEIELSISITNATSGGIDFKLFGAEVDASADFQKTVFHKINLNFSSKG
jgi:hypothetical protein